MADAGAAVVGDPVDWAGGGVGEDFFEGFQDGEADFTFVDAFGERAYAVTWELGDVEGGVRFPRLDDLWVGLVVSRYLFGLECAPLS